jgi:hypothetical protein
MIRTATMSRVILSASRERNIAFLLRKRAGIIGPV